MIWWSFCNEVGCNNESAAQAFREVSKLWDPTRAVTQVTMMMLVLLLLVFVVFLLLLVLLLLLVCLMLVLLLMLLVVVLTPRSRRTTTVRSSYLEGSLHCALLK